MKFGTHYAYWTGEAACDFDGYAKLIEKVAQIGFDLLEVSADHVYHMSADELGKLKELGKARNIGFTTNSGPAKEYDLASRQASVRETGVKYFEKIFDNMVVLGSTSLAGAIYSFWPCEFTDIDKQGAWARSVESLKVVAKAAEKRGITVSLEVLNRNETYIMNTCEEALEYCRQIGSPAIKLLLDTYHMNIEEDDPRGAIRAAGPLLGHLHVGENNRKLPGMNNSINWKALGGALKDIGYQGNVVMEPFLKAGGPVGDSIRLWRDLSDKADEQEMDRKIKTSLVFLREAFA